MGAGKSTVGRRLANKLAIRFYDSDRVIEERTGVNTSMVFEYEGEQGFRVREKKAIDELCQLEDIVLATGGGAILSASIRARLKKTGTVFYLKASIEILLQRTKGDTNRPLLKTSDQQQTIAALLQQREPLYREVSDHIIITDRHTANWAVEQVLNLLPKR